MLLGGALAAALLAWRRGYPLAELADVFALTLPPMYALGAVGLLMSGEAFGQPTDLPWAIDLLGTSRHPTQIYIVLAALFTWGVLGWLAQREPPAGGLAVAFLGLHGLSLLLTEALRADSLTLPAGLRITQIVGLLLLLLALGIWRAWLVRLANPPA
jgi:prolipoprotein diacylglyceryltransferase